ncbi:MAG: hypothetical protein ACYDAZ_01520 [Thermoplasmataceae archaeon]
MSRELVPGHRYILEKLGIPFDAQIEEGYRIHVDERELVIDLAIKSGGTLTLVEIKSRINEDTIYRIYALSKLISGQLEGGSKLRLVCAGKSLKYSTRGLSAKLGVETLLIPQKLYHYFVPMAQTSKADAPLEHLKASPSKLTSEKAWKVVCSILRDRPLNILAISKQTGISYGWTNAIIHKLMDSGIADTDYAIRIKDLDRLLNAVSWERAFDGFLVDTINTNFRTATQCINEVALNLNRLGIDYAFTAHSSAAYYGSSIVRDDTAYVYLPNTSDRDFLRSYSGTKGDGCRLKVYVPDRNIMESSEVFRGIRVVDVCQNILDLAGLGVDGRISAKDLVNRIGK